MKFGVVIFPGSNCDADIIHVCQNVMQCETRILWHKDTSLQDLTTDDCIMIPGGFSYGDYLRCGAIARFSPIMEKVIEHANNGGYVFGICNGFQILIEAGLLPGALLRNKSLNFVCKDVYLRTMNNSSIFTSGLNKEEVLKIPVAHGEGNYFAEPDTIKQLEDSNRIAFKYCSQDGTIDEIDNPNGSLNNIAGIFNENKNVLGLMPHPERYSDGLLGCSDGLKIFKSILSNY